MHRSRDGRLGRHLNAQHLAGVLGGGAIGLGHPLQELRQGHGRKLRARGAPFDLADQEQRAEGGEHLVSLAEGLRHGRLILWKRGPAGLQRPQPVPDAGEGGTKVMRDVAGHLPQALHQGLDSIEHSVEVGGQLVEFVAHANGRQPFLEVSLHDAGGRQVDGLQAPQKSRADK